MDQNFRNEYISRDRDKLIQNVVGRIRPSFKNPQKSCYYPSSGHYIKDVYSLDADCFFFSEQRHFNLSNVVKNQIHDVRIIIENDSFVEFETPGKRGYYFYLESNIALEVIRRLIPNLNYFIGNKYYFNIVY